MHINRDFLQKEYEGVQVHKREKGDFLFSSQKVVTLVLFLEGKKKV